MQNAFPTLGLEPVDLFREVAQRIPRIIGIPEDKKNRRSTWIKGKF